MALVPHSVKLLILEEVELYRPIYEPSAFGASIELVSVEAGFDIAGIGSAVGGCAANVLLVGVRKPENATVAALKELRRRHHGLGIVYVFSSFSDDAGDGLKKLARTGQGGMALYLRESLEQVDQLRRIVMSVSRGQVVLDPALTQCLFADDPESQFLSELTPKEKEILERVARGYTNASIAREMFVDVKTVEHHLNNIYGKLKANSDCEERHPRVTVARLYLEETGELQAS